MTYLRHSLCYLDKQTAPVNNCSAEQLRLFQYWLYCSYPFIVTRQLPELRSGEIQLAIPYFLHEQAKKIRASFIVSSSAITETRELPLLNEIFPHLGKSNIKVYGSYCWQYLTKENYIQETSDLDLLVTYENQSLSALTNLYRELQTQFPKQAIDGEIRFSGAGDCSWKELLYLSANESILFKSIRELSLLTRDRLYASFPALLF